MQLGSSPGYGTDLNYVWFIIEYGCASVQECRTMAAIRAGPGSFLRLLSCAAIASKRGLVAGRWRSLGGAARLSSSGKSSISISKPNLAFDQGCNLDQLNELGFTYKHCVTFARVDILSDKKRHHFVSLLVSIRYCNYNRHLNWGL